jgi:hypothetical protein
MRSRVRRSVLPEHGLAFGGVRLTGDLTAVLRGAGDRDRTGMASLEGGALRDCLRWSATCQGLRISARDPHVTQGIGVTHA